MSQKLDSAEEHKELATRLRRDFPQWGQELLANITPALGLVGRLFLWAFRWVVPAVVFRIRLYGRIPLLSGVNGWFMDQPMAGLSSSFVGFGCRLTINHRQMESRDQLERLLVQAFLEDLRAEYRWRPWRRWRRTHPVVFLDHVKADGAAARLVSIVNAIRNDGKDDPLLIVANAIDVSNMGQPKRADRAKRAYERWAGQLPADRRQHDGSWLLWVTIPPTSPTDDAPEDFRPIVVSRSPRRIWWTQFATGAVATVLVVGLVIAAVCFERIITSPPPPCHIAKSDEWSAITVGTFGTCVGFSAYDPEDPSSGGRGYLFGRQDGQKTNWLISAQKAIYQQNRRAEAEAKQPNARPLVTLVYFGQLSDRESYAPEREDLEGLLLAQQDALGHERAFAPSSPRPLIRLVLANIGRNLVDGSNVVSMLSLLFRGHGVVGAVGTDESRRETVAMLHSLAIQGIPVIGTSLSADELANSSPTYFQLSAPDKDIAFMIKAYLDSDSAFSGRKVRIYRLGDPDDLYTNDTAEDVDTALGEYSGGIRSWDSPGAFSDSCGDVIFFAGRDLQFGEFLRKLQAGCTNKNVTLLADDSANRFMDSTALRAQAHTSKQSLIYVAKASLVACNYPGAQYAVTADNIFRQLAESHGQCLGVNLKGKDEIGERTVLSYDAVQLFMDAVQSLSFNGTSIPVTGLSVWGALRSLQTAPQLAGGMLNYSPPVDPARQTVARVPNNKWRGLLQVDDISVPPTNDHRKMIYGCGQITPTGSLSQGQCRRNPFG